MTGPLRHPWNHNAGDAQRLGADIPEDTMALPPAPDMHQAARRLGMGRI